MGASTIGSTSCFARLLGELLPLSAAECAVLERLEERERPVRRGATLVRENDPAGELFILKRGTMMSSMVLPDGSRQILCFHFPGDLLGAASLVYRNSPQAIVARSEAVVCPLDRLTMPRLMREHPRLSAAIMALDQIERVALTDRLTGLGRTSAKSRVAALLLVIRDRMRAADRSIGATFAPGLTQEEIGDATGLTSVHVNRMLRQLEDDGLIRRENGRVTVLREGALAAEAHYVNRYAGLDLDWLSSEN